jgi:amidase
MEQGAAEEPLSLGPDTLQLTLDELVEGYRRDQFDISSTIDECLARIEAWDYQGPILNAMVTIDAQVRERAEALYHELVSTGVARPLHGVPVVINDNINVAGLQTTGGSVALIDWRPTEDACVVRRLKEAGVVIVGKSYMS